MIKRGQLVVVWRALEFAIGSTIVKQADCNFEEKTLIRLLVRSSSANKTVRQTDARMMRIINSVSSNVWCTCLNRVTARHLSTSRDKRKNARSKHKIFSVFYPSIVARQPGTRQPKKKLFLVLPIIHHRRQSSPPLCQVLAGFFVWTLAFTSREE